MEENIQSFLVDINEEINWHDKKSVLLKKRYIKIKMLSAILTSFIPVLALVGAYYQYYGSIFSIAAAVFAAAVAILEAYLQLNQVEKLFTLYRNTCEELKQERLCFNTATHEYSQRTQEDMFSLFSNRCIRILRDTRESSLHIQQYK